MGPFCLLHNRNVFDKSKPDYNNEFPIQSVNIELCSLTQLITSLMQRVTELEKAQSSYAMTIQSLKKSINALKAENVTISNTTTKLQSDVVSHATVWRNSIVSILLSTINQEYPKYVLIYKQQISNTKAQKSYVSAVFPQKTPSPTEVEFNGTSHLDEQAKSTYSVSADSFSVCWTAHANNTLHSSTLQTTEKTQSLGKATSSSY